MNRNPKIVGYGICGPNEPYLEHTLIEFKRLCDDVIICGNNITQKERALIKRYGFGLVEDDREWGINQWKIKQDFVTNTVSKFKPDLCVCMDMDEVFDKNLTKEDLRRMYQLPFEAFYFRIINLWDDGYAPDRTFWNIRAWKWIPEFGTLWPKKNVHCGLGPEWTWGRGWYTPYILKHYGLKDKERREQKARRYQLYDPKAQWMSREYYDSLTSMLRTEPFDEDKLHEETAKYVHDIKQKYVAMNKRQEDEVVYIKIPDGSICPIPKAKLNDYLKRPGHEYISDVNPVMAEVEQAMDGVPHDETPVAKSWKWSWEK